MAHQEFKSIREMFYTTSDLPVITPDNANSFLSVMQRFKGRFVLSSYCSGSSKLSAVMPRTLNRFIVFPVEYDEKHRVLSRFRSHALKTIGFM